MQSVIDDGSASAGSIVPGTKTSKSLANAPSMTGEPPGIGLGAEPLALAACAGLPLHGVSPRKAPAVSAPAARLRKLRRERPRDPWW